MRVNADDEVYRVNTVWLGPTGLTLPWTARYTAYATWLVTFLLVLLVEGITPLRVHIPPIWELSLTTLFTYGVMGFIDYERPLAAVWQTFKADVAAPRSLSKRSFRTTATTMSGIHISERRPRRTFKQRWAHRYSRLRQRLLRAREGLLHPLRVRASRRARAAAAAQAAETRRVSLLEWWPEPAVPEPPEPAPEPAVSEASEASEAATTAVAALD